MAAPNILGATSIYGKTIGVELNTTTTSGILTCAADKVLKIKSIIVCNIDGGSSADVTASFYDSSKTVTSPIASTMTVPADSALVILDTNAPIYLEESDEIRAGASANADLQMVIGYEELDDA